MDQDVSADALFAEGFEPIGELKSRLCLAVWWRADVSVQLLTVTVGSLTLLKGSKSYYLKSVSEDGETYARDIGQLHDYLEAHFSDLHLGFSQFRDVPASLAREHIHRRSPQRDEQRRMATIDELADLQQAVRRLEEEESSTQALLELESGDSALLRSHLQERQRAQRREAESLGRQRDQARDQAQLLEYLQHEYERHGAAVVLSFTVNSNLQLVESPASLRDAVRGIVKELRDLHRFQVTQKLNGGRLQVQVAEAEEPLLTWLEQWLGGALTPKQLERLQGAFTELKARTWDRCMVTPKVDIRTNGHEREHRKLLGPRVVSALLSRVDRSGFDDQSGRDLEESDLPLRLGRLTDGRHMRADELVFPLRESTHGYVSGATGSGKSYFGRVLVEEAARHDDLNVLILDPRNQAAGLLVREDRETILSCYASFGMRPDDARGYNFVYHGPGHKIGRPLPSDLATLGTGRNILSFKGLDDRERCRLFADVLDHVFERWATSEAEQTRLLIVIEEAHRFTKKRVAQEAKAEGGRAEVVLDRVVREGRKFGVCVYILSQTIRDFAYESASIRQNTGTKVFMRNSDREVDYAADFIGDGRRIMKLKPGTAILHSAALGPSMFSVRPPMSKVWEFSPKETGRLIEPDVTRAMTVSGSASELLEVLRTMQAELPPDELCISAIADRSGITSKRRLLDQLEELECAGLVRSRRLRRRGSPRIVELVSSEQADEKADATGTEGDGT